MLLARSTEEARRNQRRIEVNGREYVLSAYIGAAPVRGMYVEGNEVNDDGLPQGFLVEQPPGSVTKPHFHEVNQFQVFVGGVGRLGKHAAGPLTVQYAGAHSPYGPIEAGDGGVTYFTLRAAWDPGAKYMPQSRDKLQRGRQRQKLGIPMPPSDSATLRAQARPETVALIEREADGMAAWLMRLGSDAEAAIPDPASGGGQNHVVIGGTLNREGGSMPALSCLYATPDEPAYTARAGAAGLELLVLQFPRAACSR
ncbi:MAG: hypothetical protein ACREF6_10730 [Alphaproteobacteria bacterium]